jgi:serine/threonine-protein kinase RsbW
MTITTESLEHDVTAVVLEGEMDLYSANRLKETVVQLWEAGTTRIIIDLSDLSYVDSSGIGVLLYVYSSSQKRSYEVVFCGAKGSVAKVIELTKLKGFLPLEADRDAALNRFSPVQKTKVHDIKQLVADGSSPLFEKRGMYYKEFNIDLSQVRRLSNLIAQRAPAHLRDINILEQQISELIKNAVKHGNKNDKEKSVKIWFLFSDETARMIVEDQGDGFQDLEKWNEFYRKKIECYRNQDFEKMMDYLTFRTERSTEEDGGNAMMAAVEYWNAGVVFNDTRNAIAVMRSFSDEPVTL